MEVSTPPLFPSVPSISQEVAGSSLGDLHGSLSSKVLGDGIENPLVGSQDLIPSLAVKNWSSSLFPVRKDVSLLFL